MSCGSPSQRGEGRGGGDGHFCVDEAVGIGGFFDEHVRREVVKVCGRVRAVGGEKERDRHQLAGIWTMPVGVPRIRGFIQEEADSAS